MKMKKYSYFPGCSMDGTAAAYEMSVMEVAKILDFDLIELEDWNCCGATAGASMNDVASHSMVARNLALASEKELDLVTPCSACYTVLKTVQANVQRYPDLKVRVEEVLRNGNAPWRFKPFLNIRHLLEVIVQDIGLEAIASKRVRSLNGLKVAPYFGCQVVRPWFTFDDPEFPESLDRLVETLGGEAVPFSQKTACCGASLMLSAPDVGLSAVRRILDCAQKAEADCIITACPLCQTNLDAYQGRINRRLGTKYDIPVFFFTQLLGFALGADPATLGMEKGIVPQEKVLLEKWPLDDEALVRHLAARR